MTAVLQFEFDRKRVGAFTRAEMYAAMNCNAAYSARITPTSAAETIIRAALDDTMQRGGTFVLVATPDKLTVVQRPEAVDIDEAEERP